jgi:hypothetical protein
VRDGVLVVLRNLLQQKAKAVGQEAAQSGGVVPAEQSEELGRLARLVEVYSNAHPPAPPPRWPLGVALGVTLLAASVMLFVRVSETEVELELVVSEAGFTLPARQVLTGGTAVAALGVSGLREIQLPITSGDRAGEDEVSAVRLSPVAAGTVDLAALALPEGTRVRVLGTAGSSQYRLSLEPPQGSALDLRVDVNGPVLAERSGRPAERLQFPSPKAVVLLPESGDVDLELTFAGGAATPFARQIAASNLSLHRVDEFIDPHGTLVRQVSTVLSGTLYRQSLNGEERRLRPAEWLRFSSSRGEIRTLELRGGEIALTFHGWVRGMTTGSVENPQSLMPTWLEWLRARHGLSLLWGTALYLFGLAVGVLRWWRLLR